MIVSELLCMCVVLGFPAVYSENEALPLQESKDGLSGKAELSNSDGEIYSSGDEVKPRLAKLGSIFALKALKKKLPFLSFSKPNHQVNQNEEFSQQIMCETMGGTSVGEECLKFVNMPSTFMGARGMCKRMGGDLYVPLENEGFLFAKYFLYFPQAFMDTDVKSLGWIGALRGGAGAPVLTLDGRDVTKDAIYNIFTITGSECVHIALGDGNAFLKGLPCDELLPFTCEFVFDETANKIFGHKSLLRGPLTPINHKYVDILNKFNYPK